jgi:hypothetical protein
VKSGYVIENVILKGGIKMIIQRVKKKSTFIVFAFLLAIILSGASFAIAPAKEPTTYSYVVETETTYYGPCVIQDAISDENTLDGYNVQLVAGEYYEPVIVDKSVTIKGTGSTPEDTVIIAGGEDGTVTIGPGVSVVLENLSILNMGEGSPVINNGQLTLTNCFLNGVYVSSEVRGEAVSNANTETTTSTDTSTSSLALASVTSADSTTTPAGSTVVDQTTETGTTTENGANMVTADTEGSTTDADGSTPVTEGETTNNTNSDTGIPLASFASGMLMVMGGTVISSRKKQ